MPVNQIKMKKLILNPICKIHKVEMKEMGFERGYRVWSCDKCLNKENEKNNKN